MTSSQRRLNLEAGGSSAQARKLVKPKGRVARPVAALARPQGSADIATQGLRISNVSDEDLVRARAPLRLGLAGGGTDLSPYSDLFGGAVLNVTIHRYAYASLALRKDNTIVLRANDLGVQEHHAAGELPTGSGLVLHRAVFNRVFRQFLGQRKVGLELSTWAEAAPGSGLGSSSALVVAMVEAFRAKFNLPLGLYDLADVALQIERRDVGLAGGKQDHYAAAFGGVNFIEFLSNDRVIVNPMRVAPAILNELQSSIVICFTGVSRKSDNIIRRQINAVVSAQDHVVAAMHGIKKNAFEMKEALLMGDIELLCRGMNKAWQHKKLTARPISNRKINTLEAIARENGAKAAKISGAGGGGYMMLIVDPNDKPKLVRELEAAGGVSDTVVFTHRGVEAWTVSRRG